MGSWAATGKGREEMLRQGTMEQPSQEGGCAGAGQARVLAFAGGGLQQSWEARGVAGDRGSLRS